MGKAIASNTSVERKITAVKKNISQTTVRSVSPVAEKLIAASRTEKEILFIEYNTNLEGYSEAAAEELREKYGRNEISHEKPKPLYKRLVEAFINPFTVVLFILATVSLVTDVILASPGEKKFVTVVIICTMVLISGFLRFIQETRSNNSAEKLKAMVHTTVVVGRGDEGKKEIPLADLVPGDIVYLAAGDIFCY